MNDDKWFACSHCRAMFRADNNICISCGAPADLWQGNAPFRSVPVESSMLSFDIPFNPVSTATQSIGFLDGVTVVYGMVQ